MSAKSPYWLIPVPNIPSIYLYLVLFNLYGLDNPGLLYNLTLYA